MRSAGKVLLTPISVISSGLRAARRATAAIRSRTSAIFSAIDIKRKPRRTQSITKENRRSLLAPDQGVRGYMICEELPEAPSCTRLGGKNASVPTQPWTGEGARLSTSSFLHHPDWRRGFAGVARAREWNPDHDEGQSGHYDESREIRGVGKYLGYFPIADLGDSHDSSPDQAHQGFSDDQPRRSEHSRVLHPRPLRGIEPAALGEPIPQSAEDSAEEDRERRLEGQVHSYRNQHRATHLHHDHADAHEDAYNYKRPWHIAAHNSHGERRHKPGLWCRQIAAAKAERVVQERERKVHHQARHHHCDQLGHLNPARGAAEDVADFEVL